MSQLVEIRSYDLNAGTRDRFHEFFVREALPMFRRCKIDVVAYGPSLHNGDSYFLVRACAKFEDQHLEDALPGKAEWQKGPGQAMVANIRNSTAVVLRIDETTLRGLRRANRQMPDETRLKQLNDQYIAAFLAGDVGWYEMHLADDFVCIESDGSLLDKAEFLRLTAEGPDVLEYRLDHVRVRVYGDTALVQATGLFTRKDGTPGKSRYIDVYVRNGMDWKVVSAQITRTWNVAR